MTEKEAEMKKCSDETLVYQDRDVSGESIFEDYKCEECGVTVTFEYDEPTKKIVEYPSGDTEVMEEQKTIQVYEFGELSEEAQEYAIEQERDRRRKHPVPVMQDQMRQAFKKEFDDVEWLELIDDEDFTVYYSLSHSQGDGVCMEGDIIWTDDRGAEWLVQIRRTQHTNYYHKNTITVRGVDVWNDKAQEIYEDEGTPEGRTVLSKVRLFCDNVEEFGYDLIEDHESRERAREHLEEVAERLYFENGKEVNQ